MSVYTYAADEVRILLNGLPVSGLADGTFVSIESDEQRYVKTTGADGSTSRARTGNKSGSITVTLQQTSPANELMTGFMLADDAGNQGVFSVLVKDSSGNSLHFANAAWIQNAPTAEYGKEINNREWVLDCGIIEHFYGGNQEQTGGGVE